MKCADLGPAAPVGGLCGALSQKYERYTILSGTTCPGLRGFILVGKRDWIQGFCLDLGEVRPKSGLKNAQEGLTRQHS